MIHILKENKTPTQCLQSILVRHSSCSESVCVCCCRAPTGPSRTPSGSAASARSGCGTAGTPGPEGWPRRQDEPGPPRMSLRPPPSTPRRTRVSRQHTHRHLCLDWFLLFVFLCYVNEVLLTLPLPCRSGEGEEGEHASPPRRACQHFLVGPNRTPGHVSHVHLTGGSRAPAMSSQWSWTKFSQSGREGGTQTKTTATSCFAGTAGDRLVLCLQCTHTHTQMYHWGEAARPKKHESVFEGRRAIKRVQRS